MTTATLTPDRAALDDLVTFARIEVDAGDVEPWAALLRALRTGGDVDGEGAAWLVKLYNAYDDLASAWQVFTRWPTPYAWATAPDRAGAATYPCTQERRNLRGGRVLRHLDSYTGRLAAGQQIPWLAQVMGVDPYTNFTALTTHLRRTWGTGRQSAFEWAEFAAKVLGLAASAPDAQLWESEGPRRSLQRIYGNPHPDAAWLSAAAEHCRAHLAAAGVDLSWEDFETVICDFNVMRDGRYYPGRHLAALREEITTITTLHPAAGPALDRAWAAVVPGGWADIPAGISKPKLSLYRATGKIVDSP